MSEKRGCSVQQNGKLYQGVAKTDFGYRMLQNMGWAEGKGLGASGSGITKHVSLVKRQDHIGVGADGKSDSTAKVDWTRNTHALDAVLAGLQQHHATQAAPQDTKRAKRRKKDTDTAAARGSDSDEDAAVEPARAAPAAAPARGRPQGRYIKREAGKLVTSYSDRDLSQILGCIPGKPFPVVAAAAPSRPPADAVPLAAFALAEIIAASHKRKERGDAASAPAVTPPKPGWWGSSTFAWAGCLGSAGQPLEDEHAHLSQAGFSEADQVKAFNAVTDAAVTGHRGLGVADLPRGKGPKWAGTKTVFDTDGQQEDAADGEGRVADGSAPPKPEEALSLVKWKKHAARFLRTHTEGRAHLTSILEHVLAAVGMVDVCRRSAMAALSRRLSKSSQFIVEDDIAALAADGDT